jgi:hypothetical protein
MEVEPRIIGPGPLVLVDDVITKGRTLIAAAKRLAKIYPDRSITAFALIRYRGFVDEFESRIDPCIGTLTWADTDVIREP